MCDKKLTAGHFFSRQLAYANNIVMKSDPSSILTLINDPWGHFNRVFFYISKAQS